MSEQLRAQYRQRIRYACKLIGIAKFATIPMHRLVNRLTLIKGDAVTDPDLRVLVRLYSRELIGRQDIPPRKQKELLT